MNSPRGSCTFPRVNYLSLHLPNESAVRVIKQLHFTMASSSSANTIPPVCSLVPAGGVRRRERERLHFVAYVWKRAVSDTLTLKQSANGSDCTQDLVSLARFAFLKERSRQNVSRQTNFSLRPGEGLHNTGGFGRHFALQMTRYDGCQRSENH